MIILNYEIYLNLFGENVNDNDDDINNNYPSFNNINKNKVIKYSKKPKL